METLPFFVFSPLEITLILFPALTMPRALIIYRIRNIPSDNQLTKPIKHIYYIETYIHNNSICTYTQIRKTQGARYWFETNSHANIPHATRG